MDRLKKLWNCYKERSLERFGNSISSNSSCSTSANNVASDVKVAKSSNLTNCVLFSFSSSNSSFSSFFFSPQPTNLREDFHNLQVNVESLSKRINTAPAKPVESYKYESTNNDVIDTNPDPIISSAHSSPQNSNVTYANLPQSEHTVDDNANYAISNNNDPKKSPSDRESSIKYVNDAEDEPVYYNEPPYYEQPGNSLRFDTLIQKLFASRHSQRHPHELFLEASIHIKEKSTEINRTFPFSFFPLTFSFLLRRP